LGVSIGSSRPIATPPIEVRIERLRQFLKSR
jgi:hypothetical protein